jgi:multidrug resistance protein, MATE family
MYGHFGMPALGPVGTGVATALVWWVMFFALLVHVARHRFYRPYAILRRLERPNLVRCREVLALGVPISGSLVAESGLFSTAGLMIGTLGATLVAAHQIALNYAVFMFMAPMALHSATTIEVGHALGRGARSDARRAGLTGIALCGALMLLSSLVILVARDEIAALYTDDAAVRPLAASLLLLAGVFQVADGLQVGASGALRGFKDARVPLLISVLCYWGIGFPIAFGAGVYAHVGPAGVWYGLIAGLIACALLLNLRFLWLSASGRSTPGGSL